MCPDNTRGHDPQRCNTASACKKRGLATQPPTLMHHVQQYTRRPTTHHEQQYISKHSSTWVRSCAGCCCIVLRFPCFCDPPIYWRPRTVPFDDPNSPSFGVGARVFAGDNGGCSMGAAWRGRAAVGCPVAIASSRS